MALLNAGLAMLTVGYILGVWTACAIFHERQRRDGDHTSMQRSMLSVQAVPQVIWISERRE
ncbi:MAG TPA: hypothetical protein VGU71_19735 [Candidatus Dormibacteraeota bacterium]|nr:hypothetical protein [Candidatus Dormibacteraeota bacterium]